MTNKNVYSTWHFVYCTEFCLDFVQYFVKLLNRIQQVRRGIGLLPLLTTEEQWALYSCMMSLMRNHLTLYKIGKYVHFKTVFCFLTLALACVI